MDYSIAICDDEDRERDYIAGLCQQWCRAGGHTLALRQFSSAEEFLFADHDAANFDILLLDIEMGKMDGVQLAKRIRKQNETVQIIFVTGYSDYISEGYEVAALHYLMKPVKQEKFFSVLDRAAKMLRKNERTLTVSCAGEVVRVPLYQVRYIDVQHNNITIHAKVDYTIRSTLAEVAASLDERFYRVGRSAIVNLSCIARVTKTEIVLNEGDCIPLPRGAYEGVNRAIIQMG